MKGTTNPTRLEQIAKLEREFRTFTKIFADILKVKDESARIAQNQLTRNGNSLRYKLDDLPSNADDDELQVITLGAKKVTEQFQAVTALANTFVVNSDKAVAASALARLKFVENSLKAISSTNPQDPGRGSRKCRQCWRNTGSRSPSWSIIPRRSKS